MTEWFKCSEIPPPDDDKAYLTYDGKYISIGSYIYKEDYGAYYFCGNGPIWQVTYWAHLPDKPE